MKNTLEILLAITTVFALLTTAFAEDDYDGRTQLEIAAAHGWNLPQPFILSPESTVADFDGRTMLEIAIAHGAAFPQPAVLTDMPQFGDATIKRLARFMRFLANRHYDGDVEAACIDLAFSFESPAQMNQVVGFLTGT